MTTIELITKFTPNRPSREEIIALVDDPAERQIALHYYSYEKSPYLTDRP